MRITDKCTAFLPDIRKLWRRHSDRLGYFPEGAFEDHCKKRQILVACSDHGELLGYLIFRRSRGETVIVHLCVHSTSRSRGIAKSLVQKLKEMSSDSRGISLKCRRDYGLAGFWSAIGFVARGEVRGRGKEPKALTCWWMDFGYPDLFSLATREALEDKLCLVIDANIFYGIYSTEKKDEEAKSLTADWLPDNIELCLTEEIFNEIDRRDTSPAERARNRQLAASFSILPCDLTDASRTEIEILRLLPAPKTESDRSDIRHLARAISGGALYFITRDKSILRHSDALYENCQISVLRPCDIIIQLDQIERSYEYQPARLSGTQYRLRLMRPSDVDVLRDKFVCRQKGERARDFKALLLAELSKPRLCSSNVLESPSGDMQGVFLIRSTDAEIEVPIFRVARSPLASTIGRHIIRKLSLQVTREEKSFITVCDDYFDDSLLSMLAKDGFIYSGGRWTKVSVKGVADVRSLGDQLSVLESRYPGKESPIKAIRERIALAINSGAISDMVMLEKILWPIKIVGAGITSYIVPIKPKWAQYLFDESMAIQNLFGSSELIFNAELVYYRSKRPGRIIAPARILWYVSREDGCLDSGAIKAVSLLEEVDIGIPKELYSKHRRLGVYQWKDVLKAARNDLNREIMALRFSNTHLTENTLEWKALKAILRDVGVRTSLQSPLKISEDVFCSIYRKLSQKGKRFENDAKSAIDVH